MQKQNRNIVRIVVGTICILLIPAIAMLFTYEVNWGPFDFIVIGVLLLGAGFTYELLSRKIGDATRRAIIGIVIVLAVLLIWADLAVGIFNIPGISGS